RGMASAPAGVGWYCGASLRVTGQAADYSGGALYPRPWARLIGMIACRDVRPPCVTDFTTSPLFGSQSFTLLTGFIDSLTTLVLAGVRMTQTTAVSVVALKTFSLFHGLSDEALANIARVSMMRRFPRGQSVVCAGDRPDYVYLVLTGSLKVVVSDEDGREVILSILGQGELFGEMGMFDERPRSASVIAVVPSDLVLISKQD